LREGRGRGGRESPAAEEYKIRIQNYIGCLKRKLQIEYLSGNSYNVCYSFAHPFLYMGCKAVLSSRDTWLSKTGSGF